LTEGSGKFEPDERLGAALDAHLRALTHRDGPGAALFLAVFTAVLWPTDWLVFGGDMARVHGAVTWMRVIIIATSLATWALLRSRLGPRAPALILGAGGAIVMFAVGWGFGSLGGADRPWFHLSYPALFLTVPAPVHRRHRALLVGALATALVSGFLLPYPEHRHDPMVPVTLSFVASAGLLAVAVGHLSFRIVCQAFYQSRALERASRELGDFNRTLEERVREQTRDLRLLTDHLETAREDERTRVARELHDELGQELTALNLALALTQQRFARDPQCIRGNLAELESLLARTRVTTRQLVTELRPRLLEELGLEPGLEWLARQVEQRAGVRCRLSADGLAGLPSRISTAAFRIVQEALTNVARHAHAREVELSLAVRSGELVLAVSDDGVGVPAAAERSGFGLIGMRERVTTLSGRLELGARPGGGTTLTVTLPLAAAEEMPS